MAPLGEKFEAWQVKNQALWQFALLLWEISRLALSWVFSSRIPPPGHVDYN